MTFRKTCQRKQSSFFKYAKARARKLQLGPDDYDEPLFAPQVTLSQVGKPLSYYGVETTYYGIPALCKLLAVHRTTIYRWLKYGVIPEPYFIDRKAGRMWLHFQVRPLLAWYVRFRHTHGLINPEIHAAQLRRQRSAIERATAKWHKRLSAHIRGTQGL
jgi:hypothetical protein